MLADKQSLVKYLQNFTLKLRPQKNSSIKTNNEDDLSQNEEKTTIIKDFNYNSIIYPQFINEFWTSKQRQSSSLHEISYRACFKGQLPKFFINLMTNPNDFVYDPFAGRGTTGIEAALLGRNIILNDINPLSKILSKPRLHLPNLVDLEIRLAEIEIDYDAQAEIDLSMFFHPQTESEIVSLKNYLKLKKKNQTQDPLDDWIRMVATNRLTGHSKGFFSVYTLPPNQAVLPKRQIKINEKRNQQPEYKEIKSRIIKKTKSILRNITLEQQSNLGKASKKAIFLTANAQKTQQIPNDFIQLTVTSPPFLNIVQYSTDNWLRCWFNSLNVDKISKNITMARKVDEWANIMLNVFRELYRITKPKGFIAFEVGEVKNGKIKLDEVIVPLGIQAGFACLGILINTQIFTKTSNIWGVNNNQKGTNSNRIVLFQK